MSRSRFTTLLALLLSLLSGSPMQVLAAEATGPQTTSQTPAPRAADLRSFQDQVPASASQTTAAERLAMFQSLSPAEQEQRVQEFLKLVGPQVRARIEARLAEEPAPSPRPLAALAGSGVATGTPAGLLPGGLTLAAEPAVAPRVAPLLCDEQGDCGSGEPDLAAKFELEFKDADGDGLSNSLERQLAEGLVPAYHISTGEVSSTGFVTLQDTPKLATLSFLGQVPAAVHYRVTPLFETFFNGQQQKFLQIDYLTVWNRDDGLAIGGLCRTNAAILGGLIGLGLASVLDGAVRHDWDVERSAALVAAPAANADDPAAYRAYHYYLASHEDTFFDHSIYLPPSFPWPVGNHAQMWLSKSKHSTYEGNPNFFPLVPGGIIAFTYFVIDALYYNYVINDYQYLIYLGIADSVYFSCIVEHFGERGAALPTFQQNVGENDNPIKGSSWIADSRVASKLQPLWILVP